MSVLAWVQVSGSLYGALLGSILAFNIADWLGASSPPSPHVAAGQGFGRVLE